MVAVESGVGSIYLDGGTRPLVHGELLLIPPGVQHSVFTSTELKTLECKFALDSKLTEFAEASALKFIKTDEELREALRSVELEAKLNRPLSQYMTELKLAELILLLWRRREEQLILIPKNRAAQRPRELAFDVAAANNFAKDSNQMPDNELARKIKSYIDRDLSANFELRELAKRLLETTDLSITEISERTGFNGIHYFSRCFTAYVNVSPLKYKASHRSGFVRTFAGNTE